MTNLDIIKYLATNNPARLAEFLDEIWCIAWNHGASVQYLLHKGGESGADKIIDSDLEFSESKWLEQEANTDFFLDREIEEWSKAINPISTIEAFYGSESEVIDQAIEEIGLLETLTEIDKYSSEIYDRFREEVCIKCSNPFCMKSQVEICDCDKF
jgi:hypothetical protein